MRSLACGPDKSFSPIIGDGRQIYRQRRVRTEIEQLDPALVRARMRLREEKRACGIKTAGAEPEPALSADARAYAEARIADLPTYLARVELVIRAATARIAGDDPEQAAIDAVPGTPAVP
ncbi:hypothetical protein [Nonomuraea sp. bgisy101]|uniref:hypothetical protein n=1 Tax=Nonomuraea sp. bgisy101 TaxID=3413784 RepID=UPI003D75831D